MITYHNGDLLKSNCTIICHQVNLQGVMGGGLALQIARRYPDCEKGYKEYVQDFAAYGLLGRVYWHNSGEKWIANCFTQRASFVTDYDVLKSAFKEVEKFAKTFGFSVGIPHGYGCGIASGDWSIVKAIIQEVFERSTVDCQIWRLE